VVRNCHIKLSLQVCELEIRGLRWSEMVRNGMIKLSLHICKLESMGLNHM
jgi:hypothetical protein